MRYIISTIGTSILTNLINRGYPAEGAWFGMLRDSANLKQDELEPETKTVIDTLADRALEKLLKNNIEINRAISAELNGIYGIYDGSLPNTSKDQHYLICTDTAQGQQTGELIKDFLESQNFTVGLVTPSQLSTKNTEVFTAGIKDLIKWLEHNVSWQRDSVDQVIFNLVGGFKSLQGYMQTFGAFYADEIVYIFEGSTDLIKIPRLPIQIDTTIIEKYTLEFAMMAAGAMYPIEDLDGIPETLLEPIEDSGTTVAGLSAWGELVWHRTKSDLLSQELLRFPPLDYQQSFIDDFYKQNTNEQRYKLQETLAKVAYKFDKHSGNTAPLKTDGGLQYSRYKGHPNKIDHFRVDGGRRVSCKAEGGNLILRHCGAHDYVNNNP